jgi:pilus assembly protein CpaF
MALGRFTLQRGPGREVAPHGRHLVPYRQPSQPDNDGVAAIDGISAEELLIQQRYLDAKVRLHRRLIDEINLAAVDKIPEKELRAQIHDMVAQYVDAERIALNAEELENFVDDIIHEMTGLGPIEPMLKDPTISDILINTHKQIYIERAGRLEPTPARFKDEAHLLRIINKIVATVGRRVDESHPMVDARLLDGSRVNVGIVML